MFPFCFIHRFVPTNNLSEKERITQILNDFNGKELSLTESVLNYWKKNKNNLPELYKLASVMMAISPTQASVERVFSALALVITSHRTNLGDKIMENILLTRLNHDLFVKTNVCTEEELSNEMIE